MKKYAIAVAALLASASMAPAIDLGLDLNIGGGAVLGGSGNFAQNDGFVDTKELNGGKAKATSEGYALSEGDFRGDWKSRGTGGDTHTHLNMEGNLRSETGALATTQLKSIGNGSGSASAGNSSFAGGISGGIGGAGAAGLKY